MEKRKEPVRVVTTTTTRKDKDDEDDNDDVVIHVVTRTLYRKKQPCFTNYYGYSSMPDDALSHSVQFDSGRAVAEPLKFAADRLLVRRTDLPRVGGNRSGVDRNLLGAVVVLLLSAVIVLVVVVVLAEGIPSSGLPNQPGPIGKVGSRFLGGLVDH